MNKTNHKIVLQSKDWLMQALFELMQKQSYDSITITKLCQKQIYHVALFIVFLTLKMMY